MSKFTISIIFIFTLLTTNMVYVISNDIIYTKYKIKQRKRILDFEMTSKFKVKKLNKNNIEFSKDYYFTKKTFI